jgi:RNA methyltransferase, TrmH family
MISKARLKDIQQLHHKKYRSEERLFIAEGFKTISEVINCQWKTEAVLVSQSRLEEFREIVSSIDFEVIPDTDMQKISTMEQAPGILALLPFPAKQEIPEIKKWALALDGIKDPGNLGTLIRLADWFGFEAVFLVNDCVEWTNPKVIRSSMASFLHLPIIETTEEELFKLQSVSHTGLDLKGDSLFSTHIESPGLLWFGSESHGFSETVKTKMQHWLTIPSVNSKAESLNVATAAAVTMAWAVNAPLSV